MRQDRLPEPEELLEGEAMRDELDDRGDENELSMTGAFGTELQQRLHSWAPIARQPLPFAARVLASTHDQYATLARAKHMSQAWGAEFVELGALGHINAESGLGDWPEGHAQLQGLLAGR